MRADRYMPGGLYTAGVCAKQTPGCRLCILKESCESKMSSEKLHRVDAERKEERDHLNEIAIPRFDRITVKGLIDSEDLTLIETPSHTRLSSAPATSALSGARVESREPTPFTITTRNHQWVLYEYNQDKFGPNM
jgi:adenine-specific DNA glycosylase